MNAAIDVTRSAEELAGAWTDAALEILRAYGVKKISVAMELEVWRTMTHILRFQMPATSGFHLRPFASMENLKEQVLFRATLLLRRALASRLSPAVWNERIRSWIGEHDSSSAERALFFQAFRGRKSTRRTDAFPKVGATMVGG